MSKIAEIIDEETVYVYDKSQFDAYAIRNCGQVFRDFDCVIEETNDKIVIKGDSEKLWEFFDLDTDYNEIKRELSKFDLIKAAVLAGGGIRILRQPFVPCVVSFIISANNNIKRFSKTIEKIGELSVKNLLRFSEEDFRRVGCGYRSAYLVKAVRQLAEVSSEEISKLDNECLYKELRKICGVGDKICRCVLLFCFHRLDVVPVDTWLEKVYRKVFNDEIEKSRVRMAEKLQQRWGKYAGVAQQYVFYYMQNLRGELK